MARNRSVSASSGCPPPARDAKPIPAWRRRFEGNAQGVEGGAATQHKWCMELEKLNCSLTSPEISEMLRPR
jgi:hypothetical protein